MFCDGDFLMILQNTAAYLIKGFSPIFQFKRFIAVWARRVIKKTSLLGNSQQLYMCPSPCEQPS